MVMRLVQPARLNGHDAFAHLSDVLRRLPTQLNSRLEGLLPHRWGAHCRSRYSAVMNPDIRKLTEFELVELNRQIVARLRFMQGERLAVPS